MAAAQAAIMACLKTGLASLSSMDIDACCSMFRVHAQPQGQDAADDVRIELQPEFLLQLQFLVQSMVFGACSAPTLLHFLCCLLDKRPDGSELDEAQRRMVTHMRRKVHRRKYSAMHKLEKLEVLLNEYDRSLHTVSESIATNNPHLRQETEPDPMTDLPRTEIRLEAAYSRVFTSLMSQMITEGWFAHHFMRRLLGVRSTLPEDAAVHFMSLKQQREQDVYPSIPLALVRKLRPLFEDCFGSLKPKPQSVEDERNIRRTLTVPQVVAKIEAFLAEHKADIQDLVPEAFGPQCRLDMSDPARPKLRASDALELEMAWVQETGVFPNVMLILSEMIVELMSAKDVVLTRVLLSGLLTVFTRKRAEALAVFSPNTKTAKASVARLIQNHSQVLDTLRSLFFVGDMLRFKFRFAAMFRTAREFTRRLSMAAPVKTFVGPKSIAKARAGAIMPYDADEPNDNVRESCQNVIRIKQQLARITLFLLEAHGIQTNTPGRTAQAIAQNLAFGVLYVDEELIEAASNRMIKLDMGREQQQVLPTNNTQGSILNFNVPATVGGAAATSSSRRDDGAAFVKGLPSVHGPEACRTTLQKKRTGVVAGQAAQRVSQSRSVLASPKPVAASPKPVETKSDDAFDIPPSRSQHHADDHFLRPTPRASLRQQHHAGAKDPPTQPAAASNKTQPPACCVGSSAGG